MVWKMERHEHAAAKRRAIAGMPKLQSDLLVAFEGLLYVKRCNETQVNRQAQLLKLQILAHKEEAIALFGDDGYARLEKWERKCGSCDSDCVIC